MNKKGFTLVEMLAVIAIMVLIVGIAIPSISSIMDKSNEKAENAQESEFISLAKIYGTTNKASIEKLNDDSCYFLSLNDMVEIDLLNEIPTLSSKGYNGENGIEICKKTTGITYTFKDTPTSESIFDMPKTEVVYDDLTIPSTGTSGSSLNVNWNTVYSSNDPSSIGTNEPNLSASNLGNVLPVVYDESCEYGNGCWRKADTTGNNGYYWYDYSNGMWANVVELKSAGSFCLKAGTGCYDTIEKHTSKYYIDDAPVNTPISMDDINGMYVWIPRFAYNMDGTYNNNGSNSVTATNPGKIQIKFNNQDFTNSSINLEYSGENGASQSNLINELENNIQNFLLIDSDNDGIKESYIHPAFLKENFIKTDVYPTYTYSKVSLGLTKGFWVQKFEGDGLPYTYETIYGHSANGSSYKHRKVFTDIVNDSMITNFEWAAIAYLSQSEFGIANKSGECPNGMRQTYVVYPPAYKKDSYNIKGGTIHGIINENDSLYTYDGRNMSGIDYHYLDTEGSTVKYAIMEPNNDRYKGYCGSTSGTVYGVYDMSGGLGEYVMISMLNNNGIASTEPMAKSADNLIEYSADCYGTGVRRNDDDYGSSTIFSFSILNRYSFNNPSISSYKKGDATYEVQGWFNNNNNSFIKCGSKINNYTYNSQESKSMLIRGIDNIFHYRNSDGYNEVISETRYTYK